MDATLLRNTLVSSLVAAAVLLLVLWPTRNSGARLLQTWGIPAPTGPQVGEAVRYLRRRRILAVALFIVLPPVAGLLLPQVDGDRMPVGMFVPLLVAMLVAELIATLRPVSGVRVASLDPRGWRDLVPRWAVAVLAALTGLVAALLVLGLAARPRATPPGEAMGWRALAGAVLCLLVVAALVHLAVRRPAVSDAAVDAALRTRTARVAVAIGTGWLGVAVVDAGSWLDTLAVIGPDGLPSARSGWLTEDLTRAVDVVTFAALLGAVTCWMWLAVPGRRSLAR